MPDFSTSFSDVASAVRTFLGLSRRSRLREQLRDTLGLYVLAEGHDDLQKTREALVEIASLETSRLLVLVKDERARQWNWGAFVVGGMLAAVGIWGESALWPLRVNWWAWFPLVALGFLDFVFVYVALQSLLQRRSATA